MEDKIISESLFDGMYKDQRSVMHKLNDFVVQVTDEEMSDDNEWVVCNVKFINLDEVLAACSMFGIHE